MKKTKAKETAAGAEMRRRASLYEADAARTKPTDPDMALRLEGRADGYLDAATYIDEYLAQHKPGEELPDAGDVADLAMMQRADSRLDDLERRVAWLEQAKPEAVRRLHPVRKPVPPSLREGGLLDGAETRKAVQGVMQAIERAPRAKALRPDDAPASNGVLQPAALTVLAVLCKRYPTPTSKKQAALLSGYSVGSGSFAKALTQLRAGYMEGETGGLLATPKGLATPGPAETPPDVLGFWSQRVSAQASAMLQVLVSSYPKEVSRDLLSDKTGYSATSGAFAKAMTELRRLELAEGWRASEALMSLLQ